LIAEFIGSRIVNRQGQGFWLDIVIGALVGGFLFDLSSSPWRLRPVTMTVSPQRG
jgi:uncharacterized membrane protein YeaQ/YmgE (transglycosylase-associated protein family)